MNGVQVLIHGLALWFMAGNPGEFPVLLPDFSTANPPHTAQLTLAPADIKGGTCPPPLASDCTFVMKPGAKGPVKIEFRFSTPTTLAPVAALCAVPKLVGEGMKLRPEYALGGGKLSAEVLMTRGIAHGVVQACVNPIPGNCPRSVSWGGLGEGVTLVLSNLPDSESVSIPLEPGAIVMIDNSPPHAMPGPTSPKALEDWCLYYKMFENPPPLCVVPVVPLCGLLPAAPPRPRLPMAIDTIACSNSQYP